MLRRPNLVLRLALIPCLLPAAPSLAQDKPRIFGTREGWDGTQCETTKAEFDLISEAAGADGAVIVIARLGRGEASRRVNTLRLGQVRGHLYYVRGIEQSRIVTAEAERVRDLGRVEIYIGGKLFTVFRMGRGKDFNKGCSV